MKFSELLSELTKKYTVLSKQIVKDGSVLKEIDIVVREDLKHSSYFDGFGKIIKNW